MYYLRIIVIIHFSLVVIYLWSDRISVIIVLMVNNIISLIYRQTTDDTHRLTHI